MTKARTNASVAPAVGRNMVINSAMNVSQRATSVAALGGASGYSTVDRWKLVSLNTAGRLTMAQVADGPNGISANCLKLDCTTADASIAAGEILLLRQGIEGQNLQRIGKGVSGAQQITISFYVKASAVFTFGVELEDTDNSRQVTKLFATTTDWVRHSFIIAADEDDGSSPFADDNAESLRVNFILHAGSNFTSGTLNTASFANSTNANRAVGISSFYSNTANNFFLTGVQMEVGPVATEFEQEDFGVTLAKCQRYFLKLEGASADRWGIGGYVVGASEARMDCVMPVTMRAIPTLSGTGNGHFDAADDSANFAIGDIVIDEAGTGLISSLGLQIATSGMTAGQSGGLRLNDAATLTLTAEL